MFKKVSRWILALLGAAMAVCLTACADWKENPPLNEDQFFWVAMAIIFVVIIGVCLGVGIPLLKAQKKAAQQRQNQQTEYENRAMRRARQYKRKR
ncbi:MAG: hypothetical protein IKZ95_07980 [Lachnospiraceae bacterium]|nr:hypothetical protein [Lachnospiraceae bacterium]